MSKEQAKYDYEMEQITNLFIEHNWHNKKMAVYIGRHWKWNLVILKQPELSTKVKKGPTEDPKKEQSKILIRDKVEKHEMLSYFSGSKQV